jgi:DNA-binding LacI/PurR family transcriptional regulator
MKTLKDVAELAGVSTSAVSRTFTEGASVSDKTRFKVMEAANELGYRPNAFASSLTTRRTKLIGLVSDNFSNPIFLQVFDLFTQNIQKRGYRPILVNLTGVSEPEEAIDMLRQYSVDGVILASSTLPPQFAVEFHNAGLPIVHSFGRHTKEPLVDVVGIDNRHCGRLAAEALVAHGFEHVGFLGGPAKATSTQDREEGFISALAEHPGIAVSVSYADAYSFDAGRKAMLDILAETPAQAYFCGDDVLSIGALSAVQEAGLQVPDDIAIIGLNDMSISGWQNIALTTIRQPIDMIIEASVERVLQLLEDPETLPQARLFPCEVVSRRTLPKPR